MAHEGAPRPSHVASRSISGSQPGLLDPSQTARLLRLPGTILSFAAFHPRVASSEIRIDVDKLSLNEELYRPKRVVIETLPDGDSFWRFVPRARRGISVEDEGAWPRVINICGELIECSQDQWDIYKLDPEYDCYVQASPEITIVTRKEPPPTTSQNPSNSQSASSSSSGHRFKRRLSPPLYTDQDTIPTKKRRQAVDDFSSSDDESEVEILINSSRPRPPRTSTLNTRPPARRKHDNVEAERRIKREKLAYAQGRHARDGHVDDGMEVDSINPVFTIPATPRNTYQSVPSAKRKGRSSHSDQDLRASPTNSSSNGFKPSKRARTQSPELNRREATERRKERERKKAENIARQSHLRKEQRERAFMEDILADIPEFSSPANDILEEQVNQVDEEEIRQAAIAESRRKLEELERDRPIWEQAARERESKRAHEEELERERKVAEAREREERDRIQRAEDIRKAAMERKRQQAEINRRAQAQKEAQEKFERERREQAEAWRRENEKKTRQQQEKWSRGAWTSQRALERYKTLCETFDATKFSADEPLTFEAVPWPLLAAPLTFSVEDVDWAGVEKFFETVKDHMRWQEYKTFVEKSHRRFHPDRWSSRRLLNTIEDETERSSLEVAANTVAQALTPLWREARGQ
ncbi:hypothetical protein HETIRDRAFT_434570 [Heterobasidion irregulare TC 32-1]|uniref:Uncharacterized protein n=1 Tax=Heterobasidion irregulare (strain TC 32-1) TaxID=747525 RepID=W4K526_HETIT|nr:uncharacterized protein HETIRDRAFT_434570 [Heterobasidion irregulare TC 32-1]ETW80475.1 hypothetical protein HETIRDRAFT_434570 [Heterobasidion irregulare TC 32-1]